MFFSKKLNFKRIRRTSICHMKVLQSFVRNNPHQLDPNAPEPSQNRIGAFGPDCWWSKQARAHQQKNSQSSDYITSRHVEQSLQTIKILYVIPTCNNIVKHTTYEYLAKMITNKIIMDIVGVCSTPVAWLLHICSGVNKNNQQIRTYG